MLIHLDWDVMIYALSGVPLRCLSCAKASIRLMMFSERQRTRRRGVPTAATGLRRCVARVAPKEHDPRGRAVLHEEHPAAVIGAGARPFSAALCERYLTSASRTAIQI